MFKVRFSGPVAVAFHNEERSSLSFNTITIISLMIGWSYSMSLDNSAPNAKTPTSSAASPLVMFLMFAT